MRYLFPLLFLLLFCGCAPQNPQPETVSQTQPVEDLSPAPLSGFYDPSSELEETTQGALKVYPLYTDSIRGFHIAGDHILLFSGEENSTTVTQLSGDTLIPGISFTIQESLNFPDISLHESAISYFSQTENRTMIMDIPLGSIRSMDAPDDLVGTPLLSADESTLYYCTPTAVRALDLSSGISRCIKETAYPEQYVTDFVLTDTVLQLSITDAAQSQRTLFLSTQNGRLLAEADGRPVLASAETGFYTYSSGSTRLFGQNGETPRLFLPRMSEGSCFFLPEQQSAVTAARSGASETILDLYSLVPGARTASLTIPEGLDPLFLTADSQGNIWFLSESAAYGCHALYRWDPVLSSVEDSSIYAGSYYTQTELDYEGLAACSLYAQDIGAKYGIEVLIYKDAVAVQPWDYELTYEYQSAVLMRELELLDLWLQNYPESFLQTLAETFTALKICIVRRAAGSSETGSLEEVDGIQFFDNTDAYIVLSAEKNTQAALYHEMSHLIESVVLTHSTAYDRWDKLNPPDFSYDLDYIANRSRDGSPWLEPGREYFIDTYSMSFPREDRARILEYAMTSGNAESFASSHMQAKLQRISTGIREAFDLEDSAEIFLWEQYLRDAPV